MDHARAAVPAGRCGNGWEGTCSKQLLARHNLPAEFAEGALIVKASVVVRKQGPRELTVEGHFGEDYVKVGAHYFVDELDTVLAPMARCVMLRVDRCQDSSIILRHYLPWINTTKLCTTHALKSHRSKDLRAGAATVILEHNAFDELAFRFGDALFEAQLKVAQQ